MKIEKINDNKIKVLIDMDEVREWNVDIKNLSKNTPEIQEMFWTAIKLAERDAEFYVDGAKLFVEAIPNQEEIDSCFGMLITKIFSDGDLDHAITHCSYKGRIKKTELKGNTKLRYAIGKRIFKFDDFENVLGAASAIKYDFFGESTLYKCDEIYYLMLIPMTRIDMVGVEKIMLEFSQRQPKTLISHGRLNELGEVMIAENAVEILCEYFD